MSNQNFNQITEQFDTFFGAPVRAFAELAVSHQEALVQNQVEAVKAYTDLTMRQVRTALQIKAPEDVQGYFQGQQDVVKELSERVRGDAEKVVSLNRKFA